MSFDCVLLIHSTYQGEPDLYGRTYHFVRLSSSSYMARVAQMQAGGRYPQEDCFPAALRSALLDRGLNVSVRELEVMCSTGTTGTDIRHGLAGAQRYTPAHIVLANPPSGLYGMNSAWGGIVGNERDYLAASCAQMVVFDSPAIPVAKPVAQPVTIAASYLEDLTMPHRFSLPVAGSTEHCAWVDDAGTLRVDSYAWSDPKQVVYSNVIGSGLVARASVDGGQDELGGYNLYALGVSKGGTSLFHWRRDPASGAWVGYAG